MPDLPAIRQSSALLSPEDLQHMQTLANVFVVSGIFEPSEEEKKRGITVEKQIAQATVKMIFGAEVGLTASASMRGIHLVKGKPTFGYQCLGALVNGRPGYKFKQRQWDKNAAKIEFYRDGESLGISEFTTEDMQTAQLGGQTWQKHKKNMLWARAMSNGVNALCPEVLNGQPAYTPADFGHAEDDEGNLIEIAEDKTPPKSSNGKGSSKTASGAEPGAQKATPAQTAKETSTKQKEQPASEKKEQAAGAGNVSTDATIASEASEVVEAEEVEEGPMYLEGNEDDLAGEASLEILLQAGIANGWTQEGIDNWISGFLSDHGIDVEADDVFDKLTVAHINSAIDYVSNNKK